MTLVVVGAIVALLLLAVAWLLLAPLAVDGRVTGSLEEGADVDVRLRFWPVGVHVHGPVRGARSIDVTVARVPWPRRPSRPEARREGSAARPARRRWRAEEIVRFLVRHRHLIVVRRLDGVVRYGFEDPALTGQTHGLVASAAPLLGPPARLTIEPDWSMQDVLAGRLDVALRVRAGRLALAVAWTLVSRSARRPRAPWRRSRRRARSDTSRTAPARAA